MNLVWEANKTVCPLYHTCLKYHDTIDVVHSDISGSFEVYSLGGKKYFITLVDKNTKILWPHTIKLKNEDLEMFKKLKALLEKENGKVLD